MSDPLSFALADSEAAAVAFTSTPAAALPSRPTLFAPPFSKESRNHSFGGQSVVDPDDDDSDEHDEAEATIRDDVTPQPTSTPSKPVSITSSLSRSRTSSTNALLSGRDRHSSPPTSSSMGTYSAASSSLTPRGLPSPFRARLRDGVEEELTTLAQVSRRIEELCYSNNVDSLAETIKRGVAGEVGGIDFINLASLSTGSTPLHYAASRGSSEVVEWLISRGASVTAQDGQGETPLHKGANLDTVKLLVQAGANVEAQDRDGWRILHNAASRGQLDIVRHLVESAQAQVSAQSLAGYTALMSAAAKGHLPLVQYLVKKSSNPLLRNAIGETAFDVASSIFEIEICAILAACEARCLHVEEYTPLILHSTVPIVVDENQRLGLPSLKNLSLNTLSTPRFSHKRLSRNDKRTQYTLSSLVPTEEQVVHPLLLNEVELPVVGEEFTLRLPPVREVRSGGVFGGSLDPAGMSSVARGKRPAPVTRTSSSATAIATPSSVASSLMLESAWFWLSDWTVSEDWVYAPSFDTPVPEWTSEPSEALHNLMEGAGGLGSGLLGGQKWVRKRRWVRLMRRRVDLPHFGFGDESEAMQNNDGPIESMTLPLLDPTLDYYAKAQFICGSTYNLPVDASEGIDDAIIATPDAELDLKTLKKKVVRLERALEELREGIEKDGDEMRRERARHMLEQVLQQADSAQVCLSALQEAYDQEEGDDVSFDDSRSSRTARSRAGSLASTSRSRSQSLLSDQRPLIMTRSVSSVSTRFNNDLSLLHGAAGSELRVPTRGVPLNAPPLLAVRTSSVTWEADEAVESCRCGRTFSFFTRRHHCRRCGSVLCGACTTNLDRLDRDDFARVPGGERWASNFAYRTCDDCHTTLDSYNNVTAAAILSPGQLFSSRPATSAASITSDASELRECPVCRADLEELGDEAEAHVQECLDTNDGIIKGGRYLVFKLPEGSPLIDTECSICFDQFVVADKVARLSCLCLFHHVCITAWLAKGHSCPFHQ